MDRAAFRCAAIFNRTTDRYVSCGCMNRTAIDRIPELCTFTDRHVTRTLDHRSSSIDGIAFQC